MKRGTATLAFLIFVGLFGTALANDASVGGSAANIYLIGSADIELVEETVRFTETERDVMVVTTALTFRNGAKKTRNARVGFPVATMAMFEEQDTQGFGGQTLIDDFTTRVAGKPVKTELVKTRIEGIQADAIYAFDATFPPGVDTVIEHRYRLKVSIGVPDRHWIPYVFRTGGWWAGKIHKSEFIYEFGERIPTHLEFVYGETVLVGAGRRPTGKRQTLAKLDYEAQFTAGPRPTLRVVFHDIAPNKDLELRYRAGWSFDLADFPPIGGADKASDCGESLQKFHETWAVTDDLTACYAPDMLRNYVYASRGFAFTKPEWDKLFYGKGFFLPSTEPFSESWFLKEQKAAIEKLKGDAK